MGSHNEYGRWIHQLSHQIKRRMDARLATMGITGVQSRMLRYIISHGKDQLVFQKDLEKIFDLRRSTVTGVLQLLEKNDLIRKETVPYDARLKSLVPTPNAAALFEEIYACISETERVLCRNIEPENLQIFLQVVKQMSKNLNS